MLLVHFVRDTSYGLDDYYWTLKSATGHNAVTFPVVSSMEININSYKSACFTGCQYNQNNTFAHI